MASRSSLRVGAGVISAATLVAVLAFVARQGTSRAPDVEPEVAPTTVAAPDPGVALAPGPAHRLLLWVDCKEVAQLTDRDMTTWKERGVDGFLCMTGRLAGNGGANAFKPTLTALPSGPEYELQRLLVANKVTERLRAAGLVAYLGFNFIGRGTSPTPFADWFDDRTWNEVVIPRIGEFAAAAKALGFAGLAFDEETYPGDVAGQDPSWAWNYRGNTRTENAVRQQVVARGKQVMQAIVAGFPNAELMDYGLRVPQTWDSVVQQIVNRVSNAFEEEVGLDFWNGMTAVKGYGPIRFMDATFYKGTHLPNVDWDAALSYNAQRFFALLSQRLANWQYASTRVSITPFAWIDNGNGSFEAARDAAYVERQLRAFSKWGMDGYLPIFAYRGLKGFDYGPYLSAMRSVSALESDTTAPPTAALLGSYPKSSSLELKGTATDALAIRSVSWRTVDGKTQGVGKLSAEGAAGKLIVEWSADVPREVYAKGIEITVENIRGQTATLRPN